MYTHYIMKHQENLVPWSLEISKSSFSPAHNTLSCQHATYLLHLDIRTYACLCRFGYYTVPTVTLTNFTWYITSTVCLDVDNLRNVYILDHNFTQHNSTGYWKVGYSSLSCYITLLLIHQKHYKNIIILLKWYHAVCTASNNFNEINRK